MFTLKVIFAGLVAFVPTGSGDMWVLLVDGRNPAAFEKGVLHHTHYPVVRIAQAEWAGGGRVPDFWFLSNQSGRAEGVFLLGREDLSVGGQIGSSAFGVEDRTRRAGRETPCRTRQDFDPDSGCEAHGFSYLEQKRDVSWIVRVPEVITNAHRVRAGCIAPKLTACNSVLARFRVRTGTMQVYQLERSMVEKEDPDEIVPFPR